MTEALAYLGLGGNVGDPRRAMSKALELLDVEGVRVTQVSSLYRTPPWGKVDQPDFLNAVAELRTTLTPRGLLARCLDVEAQLMRVRAERWGPRSIDLDLLWFDGRTIREAGLNVPHPRMAERAFVIVPMAEIAPSLKIAGSTAGDLARDLPGEGIVVAADPGWERAAR